MTIRIKYPVGMQDFVRIREDGFLYVDKTAQMYDMVRDRTFVFLARPRRFGKSLLVNTLAAYFAGRKELFKGLAIEKLETEWPKHPVLRFDMSVCKDVPPDVIPDKLDTMLSSYEKEYGLPVLAKKTPGDRLRLLIKGASEAFGSKVVVIVDEYDSPILAHLHDGQKDDARRALQEFYQSLKVAEHWERFVFITGITKFSHLSIFSTLNNLEDLSMRDEFADICGVTFDELRGFLRFGVERMAQKYECSFDDMLLKLKRKYDGYHFSKNPQGVFNPFSLMKAMSSGELKNYWFDSATSTYVVDHLNRFKVNVMDLDVDVRSSAFDVPVESATSSLPLLYQSGYLTIKGYDPKRDNFHLALPNYEVRTGLVDSLLESYVKVDSITSNAAMQDFYFSLDDGDIDKAFDYLTNFFSSIPYTLNNKEEKHYQTILYVLMSWLGFYTQVEVYNAIGRLDVVLFTKTCIFIMEFKVDKTAEEALSQIDKMNYAVRYVDDGRQIVKIGVNISSKTRTISEVKY